MDQRIDDVAAFHESNHFKAIDDAVYRNFLHRAKGVSPFSAVTIREGENAMVSSDVLENLDHIFTHPLFGDYVNMDYDHIANIAQDRDPLPHWEEVREMVSVTDHTVLRFILEMKVPFEKFIRHELASCGLNEHGKWVGFEKAQKIWMK